MVTKQNPCAPLAHRKGLLVDFFQNITKFSRHFSRTLAIFYGEGARCWFPVPVTCALIRLLASCLGRESGGDSEQVYSPYKRIHMQGAVLRQHAAGVQGGPCQHRWSNCRIICYKSSNDSVHIMSCLKVHAC
uniref:Uncharacterized protein n=1 Tax=Schistocephalus solidus TaxID=70667 RepID=A0A0X3NIM6_SCHSO